MLSATDAISSQLQLFDARQGHLYRQARMDENSPSAGVQDSVQLSRNRQPTADPAQSDSPLASTGPNRSLSAEEQRQVEKLKLRDQAVKAHEQAHMAAGGSIVQGGAVYQFEKGPDGRLYAVGGEVKIDSSPEQDPKETIRKMAQVRRAALAPMDPSATDRTVAARAYQLENQARAELATEQREEQSGKAESGHPPGASQGKAAPAFEPPTRGAESPPPRTLNIIV